MYMDFHVKDKTVMRPSYLYHEYPYTGKTTFLYSDSPQTTTHRKFGLILVNSLCTISGQI